MIAVVVILTTIALITGAVLYAQKTQNQKSVVDVGNEALQKARELNQNAQSQAAQEERAINNFYDTSSSSPAN